MLLLLLRIRLQSLKNTALNSLKEQPLLTTALSVAGLATFGFTCVAFVWALTVAQKIEILSETVYQLAYYLHLLLLAGSIPFVASTLLLAEDYLLLFSAPIPSWSVVTSRILEAAVINSLQFSAIGVPVLVAAGIVLHYSLLAWLALVPLTFLFLLTPALLVSLGLFGLLACVGLARMRGVIGFLNVAMGAFLCLDIAIEVPHSPLFPILESRRSLYTPSFANSYSPVAHLAPSHWFAVQLLALGGQLPLSQALPNLILLLFVNGLLFALCLFAGCRFLSSETLAQEHSTPPSASAEGIKGLFQAVLPMPLGSLVERDMRLIRRDPLLLSQLAVPAILFAVPFVFGFRDRSSDALSLLFYLAITMLGFIVYTQTSILGLSLLGMEGKGFWLMITAPVPLRVNLIAKWIASTALSLSFGFVGAVVDWFCFRGNFNELLLLLGVLLFVSASLCGIGVGLSALFPRFLHDNPAVRVSPWALILGFVAALLYVLFAGASLTLAILAYNNYLPAKEPLILIGITAFILCSCVAILLPLELGARRLEAYEWPY